MNKQFTLSDESINSYGFKVLTSGINLDRFNKNPVMYYNHDREAGVIGKWVDLSTDGNRLLGTPVFDEKDTLGAKIAGKVKDGFIKAVSIGADNPVLEFINGEYVITSCNLQECSICDIPSNENALMLYVDDKPLKEKEILKLCKTAKNSDMKVELKAITDVLELSSKATIDDIVGAITKLKDTESPERVIEHALQMNLIAKYEEPEMLQLAKASPNAFHNYMEKRKQIAMQEREEEGLKLTNIAIRDGRLDADAKGKVKSFWLKCFCSDFEGTKEMLEHLPKHRSVSETISSSSGLDRSNWTLSDYRKKAPKELKNNLALYSQLLEQEKQTK